MIKHFFKISFYSFVGLCTINFTILLFEIHLFSIFKEIPEIYIGTPINFYTFLPNEEMIYRTYLEWKYLLYDYLFFWIITFLYFQIKNNIKLLKSFKRHKTNTNE